MLKQKNINDTGLSAGDNVSLIGFTAEGEVYEPVTIARVRASMLPLPAGYVPFRDDRGGVMLAHVSRLTPR
jgi:hypothetical protein